MNNNQIALGIMLGLLLISCNEQKHESLTTEAVADGSISTSDVPMAEPEPQAGTEVMFSKASEKFIFKIEKETDLFIRVYDSLSQPIAELNINHPYYQNAAFGNQKFELLKETENSVLLLFYSQYGGDGEHTRPIAKFILFSHDQLKSLGDVVIDEPKINGLHKDGMVSVQGYYVLSLCDICDGLEAAEDEYVFRIPMNIEVRDQINYYPILYGEEKKLVIEQFEARRKVKLNGDSSASNPYIQTVTKEFYHLLAQ